MSYFFLSYAPDEDDIFVHRFYQDLCAEVRHRIGGSPHREVGYLDTTGSGGSRWPADARIALTTCQTFIALCSAKYLRSSRCGRSWTVFTERLRDYHRRTGRQARALIPIMWARQGLPEGVFAEDELEVTPHFAPEGEDLRVLMRLRSQRPAYRAFVTSLALRVVDTAHAQRLPPSPAGTDIATAVDGFEHRARPASGNDRPQQVYIVVAAGTREQMHNVRRDLRFYGHEREDWSPFQPGAPQPLATHACTVAAGRLLDSEVVPIESLPERLEADRGRADIVIVLVDAWATRVEPLRRALDNLGRQTEAEVAVLVPASRDDPETTANGKELRTALSGVFPGRPKGRDRMFYVDIDTMGSFDDDLATALAEAQRRIYRSARAVWKTPAGHGGTRPILGGP